MPDAQGNFKGITVSGEAWTRIFGERMAAHDHDWPEQNPSAGGTKPSCNVHTIWNDDPVCTECGYVWKGDLSRYADD